MSAGSGPSAPKGASPRADLSLALDAVAGSAWAMTEDGLQKILAIASRREFFADVLDRALEARAGVPLENTHKAEIRDGVAVIPVSGPLFRYANMFTECSGATSYDTLRKDLEAALSDSSVRAILFNIDSPGGEVNGGAELQQAIFEARSRKPIEAYIGGYGASAACGIAVATSAITIASTGITGSIGVRATAVLPKQGGQRTVEFISSQSPGKLSDPSTDQGRARIQARIDALAAVFIADVAKYRGVSERDVIARFGGGDVLVGAHAVRAGLADRVGTFESTLARLSQGRSITLERPLRAEEKSMNKILAYMGLSAEADEDIVVAKLQAMKLEHEGIAKERDQLAQELSAAKDAKISAEIKAAVESFKINESEAEDFKALAKLDYARFSSMLSKRESKQPGGATIINDPTKPRTATVSKVSLQDAAIAEYQKANPGASFRDAMFACHKADPDLFTSEEE